MAINKNNSQEIDRNSRIYEEYKRLSDLFEELSAEEFAVLYPTLKQAAFMRITLEDLADLITKEGCVEAYQNGANQMGMKQSAALQSYNATIKNYAATIKMLFDKLPRKVKAPIIEMPEVKVETDEEKAARINKELQEGVAYQKWQREHPKEDQGYDAWKRSKND